MSSKTFIAKRMPVILGIGFIFGAILLGFLIKNFLLKDQPAPKKMVQQITLIAPPPPPPPPPPKEQQPEPEPEIEEEVVEEEVEEAIPDESLEEIAGEDLGIDGDGSAGSDGFGLVARKGGRGLLSGGTGYGAVVQAELTDFIAADETLRYLDYRVELSLWIAQNGTVERFRLIKFDGDTDTKKLLKRTLASLGSFSSVPPLEMPQPINLRIRSEL